MQRTIRLACLRNLTVMYITNSHRRVIYQLLRVLRQLQAKETFATLRTEGANKPRLIRDCGVILILFS